MQYCSYHESLYSTIINLNKRVYGTVLLWKELTYVYLSSFLTPVAVFHKPNAIPLSFSTDLDLIFLLSWLFVLLASTFFLDVLFSFSPVVSNP